MRVRLIALASAATAIFCVPAAGVRADDFPTDGTGCQNANPIRCGTAATEMCVRWEEKTYYPLGVTIRMCVELAEVQVPIRGPLYSNAE